jgi:hypothetical protein
MMDQTNKQQGGNRRPQTFRNCPYCGKRFGPLDHLKRKFCSRTCASKGTPSGKKGKHYPKTRRARIGKCLTCGRKYRAINEQNGKLGGKIKLQRYCSLKCAQKTWRQRAKIDPEKRKLSLPRGEKNPSWAGDKVLYVGVHRWIESRFGKPRECEKCGSIRKKRYEWANIDHNSYTRDRKNWMRLCTSCHRKYDIANGIQGDAMEYRLKKKNYGKNKAKKIS